MIVEEQQNNFQASGRLPQPSRRKFLKLALGAGFGVLISGCRPADPLAHVRGNMVNPDAGTGHLLRNPLKIPPPSGPVQQAAVLIVGGGISGLSALRRLLQAGTPDAVLLELETGAGGNSIAGSNAHTRYPWAAHYLPIPDVRNTELLEFLQETGVITGYRDGLPVYNEFHLCSDPEERLFINGVWQEGLVPSHGLSETERDDVSRFFKKIEAFRMMVGADGRDAFCIPVANASRDRVAMEPDGLSFAQWLEREGFHSGPLRWYLDYCCLDDYGMKSDRVSAWAGLHYFAGRKGRGANAGHGDLLTWPEGNAFLMEGLQKDCSNQIRPGSLVYRIAESPNADDGLRFSVSVYDAKHRSSYLIRSRELIVAAPHFIATRLLASPMPGPAVAHAPWMVANLTLRQLPQSTGQGTGLCWDNVLYGSDSVGYVNARHQQPGFQAGPQVITYYKPLSAADPKTARQQALTRTWRSWLEEIVADLSVAHPGFAADLTEAEIRIWGHGMAGPLPGFLQQQEALRQHEHSYELAHTDYSGISIFEEAFYQGWNAAGAVLNRL